MLKDEGPDKIGCPVFGPAFSIESHWMSWAEHRGHHWTSHAVQGGHSINVCVSERVAGTRNCVFGKKKLFFYY